MGANRFAVFPEAHHLTEKLDSVGIAELAAWVSGLVRDNTRLVENEGIPPPLVDADVLSIPQWLLIEAQAALL